jgi:hypothetical protein
MDALENETKEIKKKMPTFSVSLELKNRLTRLIEIFQPVWRVVVEPAGIAKGFTCSGIVLNERVALEENVIMRAFPHFCKYTPEQMRTFKTKLFLLKEEAKTNVLSHLDEKLMSKVGLYATPKNLLRECNPMKRQLDEGTIPNLRTVLLTRFDQKLHEAKKLIAEDLRKKIISDTKQEKRAAAQNKRDETKQLKNKNNEELKEIRDYNDYIGRHMAGRKLSNKQLHLVTRFEGRQKTQLAGDDVRCVDCPVTFSVLEKWSQDGYRLEMYECEKCKKWACQFCHTNASWEAHEESCLQH